MDKQQMSCFECVNNNCLIKKHIDAESMQPFLPQKNTFHCKERQQFILEGAPVSGLYFIYSGCVKVFKHTANADAQIIRISKDGEIVGHRGFGTNYVYDISASAISDSVLCHFPTQVLIDMLHQTPPLMFDFMLFYADQLQKSEANAKLFGRMSVRDKVVNSLLFVSRKFGQTDGLINITLSRRDIADLAGTSEEQAIRVISALKKEGLLIAKAKRLGIPDIKKMEAGLNDTGSFLEG